MSRSHTGNSLESVSFEILAEIALQLDVKDILALRCTSKFFYSFASSHSIWLALARAMAYQRSLPLPPGRRVFNSTTRELISATIRASKLHQMLFGPDTTPIRPKKMVRALEIPDSDEAAGIQIALVEGGKYFLMVANSENSTVTCWNLQAGVVVAQLQLHEQPQHYLATVRLDEDGTETLVVAMHLCPMGDVVAGSVGAGGRLAIFHLKLSAPRAPWAMPIFDEVFSTPVLMSVPAMVMDDRTVAATGESFHASDLTILLVDLRSLKSSCIHTGVSLPMYTSLDIFTSASELVLYHEEDKITQLMTYDLHELKNIGDKQTVHISPASTRISHFDQESIRFMPPFGDLFIASDLPNSGRAGWKGLPVRFSRTYENNQTVFTSHSLDHVFDHTNDKERHRNVYTLPNKCVAENDNDEPMVWCMPGWAVYVYTPEDSPLTALRFLSFPIRDHQGSKLFERTIELPAYIDISLIIDAEFDSAWGILVLLTMDSTAYFVQLV